MSHMNPWKLTSCVLACCLVLIGSMVLAGCTQKSVDTGIVKTDAGSIAGLSQDGLRVYLGIPFAAPRPEISGGDPRRPYSPGAG